MLVRYTHEESMKIFVKVYIAGRGERTYPPCFVDFKSAFDSVWRQALFYKMLLSGVSENILSTRSSRYDDVRYCVKTNCGYTNTFNANIGIKQGYILSLTLFNMYVSDLPNILMQRVTLLTCMIPS